MLGQEKSIHDVLILRVLIIPTVLMLFFSVVTFFSYKSYQSSSSDLSGFVCLSVLGFVVPTLSSFIYLENLRKRFSVVEKHSEDLIRKRGPGFAPDESVDVIGCFDRELYSACEKLQSVYEFRRTVRQMVAHDLKGSLHATGLNLSALQEKFAHKLTDEQLDSLDTLEENHKILSDLAEHLITLETAKHSNIKLT